MKFEYSLRIDMTELGGKLFKVVADTVRSGVKNEHGFPATKGLTDERLKEWPIAIRFRTRENRSSFESTLSSVLHPNLFAQLALKNTKPSSAAQLPVRSIKYHIQRVSNGL